MEICFVQKTDAASQYPGIYLFTSLARLMRPVWSYAHQMREMIGTFEQVYMSICVDPEECYEGVRIRLLFYHIFSFFSIYQFFCICIVCAMYTC